MQERQRRWPADLELVRRRRVAAADDAPACGEYQAPTELDRGQCFA
jgi:hypothetical protein